jgi:hypothetical protein
MLYSGYFSCTQVDAIREGADGAGNTGLDQATSFLPNDEWTVSRGPLPYFVTAE